MENTTIEEKVSPKHVFLHLFVMVMLYFSTVNLLILMFQLTNFWIPDSLSQISYSPMMYQAGLVRFAVASLLIVFPVFLLTSRYLNKNYAKNNAVREMKSRKWLIYFTLFVAALVMIGDLVRIILIFLEGEITWRFIIKALSVLLVAGLIFYYYLNDLKRNNTNQLKLRIVVWAVVGLVLATLIGGFFIIGSPKNERLRRFDDDRISRLQQIQWQVIHYWRSKEQLPSKLEDLNDKLSGFNLPLDPETNVMFEYKILKEKSFELCANFNLANYQPDGQTPYRFEEYPMNYEKNISESWAHDAGRYCFERVIDPELYPPYILEKK